jgi:hypothetical protein
MTVTRDQFLKPRPRVTETVPCPEFGPDASVKVRKLSAQEFNALSEKTKANPDLAYAYWITATVVDDSGANIFTESDAVTFGEQDATLVQRLVETATKLNVVSKADAAKN